ncbi:MAG: hypothetical protein Ct9H300mP25_00500 [Acidobacteriota bacterium]|nr:MAG: hypothetical protein Ct9H300mP25_00500 [Acidobacteriota bacterium]
MVAMGRVLALWEEQVERAAGRGDEFPERTMVCMTRRPTMPESCCLQATGETLAERNPHRRRHTTRCHRGDCQGWEQRTWSSDGHRLFTRAELQCGTPTLRRTSGVSFFSTNANWVDIQLIEVGDREHLEIRRYTPIDETEQLSLLERRAIRSHPLSGGKLLKSHRHLGPTQRTIRELRQLRQLRSP